MSRRRAPRAAALAITLVALVGCASPGNIVGTIVEPTGGWSGAREAGATAPPSPSSVPVAGAGIELTGPDGAVHVLTSDRDGRFSATLPAGSYGIRIRWHAGEEFESWFPAKSVAVSEGETVSLSLDKGDIPMP